MKKFLLSHEKIGFYCPHICVMRILDLLFQLLISIIAHKGVIKAYMLLVQYNCNYRVLCGWCLPSLKLICRSVDMVILFGIRMSSAPVGPLSTSIVKRISLPVCHEIFTKEAEVWLFNTTSFATSESFLLKRLRFPCFSLHFSQRQLRHVAE